MARRLTLEGTKVLGVYEAKSTPSGLTRNIHQCLHDFDIPLHLSRTVTRVFGKTRLEGVEISQVDENMRPIPGTAERIQCDTLVLAVGLIPENEVAKALSVPMDKRTKGAAVDQTCQTVSDGIIPAETPFTSTTLWITFRKAAKRQEKTPQRPHPCAILYP